jgi:hypothetical protein
MKKALYLVIAVALMAILPAAALGQVSYDTGILIQNVGTADAEVTVYYYNNEAEGGGLETSMSYTIPMGGSQTIYPITPAAPFNGSVVIESTEPIVAIANELGDGLTYGASYEGFDMGSTEVVLPNLQSDNNGFNSWFNVQNAGAGTANVTVTYTPEGTYPTPDPETCTLGVGEACTFDQSEWTLGQWVGAANVTSDEPVVASVNIVHLPGDWGMSSYSGFTGSGSPTAILPNIMNANSDYWSGIAVTNGGAAATDITLSFTPEAGYDPLSDYEFTGVAVDATAVLLMPSHPDLGASTKWVGSVEVDGGGENVFVIVNTLNTVDGEVSAWKGFDPDMATDTVVMPAILSDGEGYVFFTGFQVVNLEASGSTNVTIEYSECGASDCDTPWTPVDETGTIAAGGSIVLLQSGTATQWDGLKYIGSATVTNDDGAPMLAIVNEIAPSLFATGEATNSYNAFNQ